MNAGISIEVGAIVLCSLGVGASIFRLGSAVRGFKAHLHELAIGLHNTNQKVNEHRTWLLDLSESVADRVTKQDCLERSDLVMKAVNRGRTGG